MPYFKVNGTPNKPRKKLYSLTLRAKDEATVIAKANREGVVANEVVCLKSMSFITEVVGVTHGNNDGSSRQEIIGECKVGDRLILDHETGNRHDKHAIRVLRMDGKQAGYLSKELAKELYDEFLLEAVSHYSAITLSIHLAYPPDFMTLGVGIFLTKASDQDTTLINSLQIFAADNQLEYEQLIPLARFVSKPIIRSTKNKTRQSSASTNPKMAYFETILSQHKEKPGCGASMLLILLLALVIVVLSV